MLEHKGKRVWQAILLSIGPVYLWAHVLHGTLSGDVFWQWQSGRVMWHLGHVLYHDPFSFTRPGAPWVAEEWGFEVLLAGAVRAMGPVAFWLLSAGVATVMVAAVVARLRDRGHSWEKSAILVTLMCLPFPLFIKDRPQVWSYALTAITLYLLDRARRHPRALWALVPLLWVWTNLHGSFLLGFVIIGLEWLWTKYPIRQGLLSTPQTRVPPALFLRVLGISVLASWVNPNGPKLWLYAAKVSFSPVISQIIAEWQSPNFHSWFLLGAVVLPLALILTAMMVSPKPVSWPDTVLTGGFFLATLHSVRFLPYYLLQWPVVVADQTPHWEFRHLRLWGMLPLFVGFELMLLFSRPVVPPGTVSPSEPVAAATYLRRHPGRVFNAYHWGGYLIYRHVPVFVDGRTDFYLPSQVLQRYLAVKTLSANPDSIFRRYRIDYVLWPKGTPLVRYLGQEPKVWRLCLARGPAVLFCRQKAWPTVNVATTTTVPEKARQTKGVIFHE